MAALTIVGAGGHGKDIAAICRAAYPVAQLIFLDDNPALGYMPTAMLAVSEWYLLGFNDPKMREEWDKPDGAFYVFHPSTSVGADTKFGSGLVCAPRVVLLTGMDIGRHVHFGYGATATRATIGDYTTVAPAATICGDVVIGKRCYIGAGATICNLVSLGDDVTVAAGATVVPGSNFPDGVTVMGTPARIKETYGPSPVR